MMTGILDLGSGNIRRDGRLRGDIVAATAPDVVLDASRLPFREESFDAVECFDLVEHVGSLTELMGEIHRSLKPGGRVLITTPHFSCANSYTDPTHVHHLGIRAFDYFEESHELSYYSQFRYRVLRRVIRFHGGLIDALIRRIAERWPDFYEHRLCWIFPAWYIEVELERV